MFEAHFQTFEEPEGGVALTARLSALREELARRKLSGFVVPRADQQQNEYVAPSEERLAWLTGFTGSAGARRGAGPGSRGVRRRPLHAAGGEAGRRQGLGGRVAGRAAAGELDLNTPEGRRPTRLRPLAAHLRRRRAAGDGLRQGRRRAGRGRQQPDRYGLDRAAAAAGRAGRRPRPALCRRSRSRQADADPRARSKSSAPTRWCCRTAMRWPGPSTSAAPTSRTRRCRCPTRWCPRTAGRPSSSITANSRTRPATISSNPPMSASPTRWRRSSRRWRNPAARSRSTAPPRPTR